MIDNAKIVKQGGGGAGYVDVTLAQNYTTGGSIAAALKVASGFSTIYAQLISEIPESGFCTVGVLSTLPNGKDNWNYVYRRTATGSWGPANFGNQFAYIGDVFRVWEVG